MTITDDKEIFFIIGRDHEFIFVCVVCEILGNTVVFRAFGVTFNNCGLLMIKWVCGLTNIVQRHLQNWIIISSKRRTWKIW